MSSTEWKNYEGMRCPTRKCYGNIQYRVVTSYDEAFEDVELRCKCGEHWWVDGPDA